MTESPHLLDDKVLAPWLEAHVTGFENLHEIRKFETGQSNPTYLVTADSGKYVLRAKPPGELLKSAHQVDREFRVMKALAKAKVPVPRVYALSNEDSPIGRMFFVMDYLDGRIFWDPALKELVGEDAPAHRRKIYDSMNKALAALHDVDVAAVGLSDFGVAGNYFERQFSRWSKQYAASEVEPVDGIRKLITWLEPRIPADDGQVSLVHGDYRLDNMVFAREIDKIPAFSIGNFPRSATHWPTSPISACNGGCRMAAGFAASQDSTARRSACRAKPNMSPPIAGAGRSARSPTGRSTWRFRFSGSPQFCRGPTNGFSPATPPTRSLPRRTAPPSRCSASWRWR